MPEIMNLVLRRRRIPETELARNAVSLSKTFGLDPYIVRVNLVGDGLAVLAKGEPDRLKKIGRVLTDLGYSWRIVDNKPRPARSLEVKGFSRGSAGIVFEGKFGRREFRRGAAVIAVLAALDGDMIQKLMAKSAFQSGAQTALSEDEKLDAILMSGPVLDFYALPDSSNDADWTGIEPLRFFPGKFDPGSLGDRAGSGARQNMLALMDLVRENSGRMSLEMDFGLCQIPDCRFDTSKDPEAFLRNLQGVSVYGWYLLQINRPESGVLQGKTIAAASAGPSVPSDRLSPAAVSLGQAAAAAFQSRQNNQMDSTPEIDPANPIGGCGLPPPPPEPNGRRFGDLFGVREMISAIAFLLYVSGGPIVMAMRNPVGRAVKFYGFEKGIFFFILSAILIYVTFYFLRLKRLMDNTPTSKARSVAMGLVEMKGVAKRAFNLLAPITLTPCVFFRLKKYQKGRNRKNPEAYTLIGITTSSHVPFYVQDDTGRVLVDPSGGSIRPAHSQTLSGNVSMAWGAQPLMLGEDLKYVEEIIPEGGRVYVLGFASPRQVERMPLGRRMSEKLRNLKSDRSKMMAYDANHDGNIDQDEWEKARADAENEALREELAASGTPRESSDQAVISRSPHSALPFIISESDESKLTRRYVIASALTFAGALAAAVAATVQALT